MKKTISLLVAIMMLLSLQSTCFAGYEGKIEADSTQKVNLDFDFAVGSAYLIEAKTGKVLYAENEFKTASPASVKRCTHSAF